MQNYRSQLDPVLAVVETAKAKFQQMLTARLALGPMTKEEYHRYLSMQFHLTREVQRHFLACAAHLSLMDRRKLREFLCNFANEEEPHFLIARNDLEKMGLQPLPMPLDVALWQSYFHDRNSSRPFHRLGATCVLENLGAGAGETGRALLASAAFLTRDNTRFLDIHFHEVLPHGDQIIAALSAVPMTEAEVDDARRGAIVGAVLYFRMARWVFGLDPDMAELGGDDIAVTGNSALAWSSPATAAARTAGV